MYLYSSSIIYEQRSVTNERADVGWDVNSETEVHFRLTLFFFLNHVYSCFTCMCVSAVGAHIIQGDQKKLLDL